MNDKSNTYILYPTGSFSSIDLSLCHPSLFLDFNWSVCKDQHHSDHFPIVIKPPSLLTALPGFGGLICTGPRVTYFITQLKNMYSYLNSSLKLSDIVRGLLSTIVLQLIIIIQTHHHHSFYFIFIFYFYLFHLHHV